MRPHPAAAVALLVVSLAAPAARAQAAGSAPPAEVSPEQKAKAQQAFAAAGRHFDAGRFEEALATFRASYEAVPSPNARLMIARSLGELGRHVEAYTEYTGTIENAVAQGERYAGAAAAARDEQVEVRARIALVRVRLAEPRADATVLLGEAPLDASRLGAELPIAPGLVRVSASLPDGSRGAAEVTATAGGTHEVVLSFAPAAPQPEIVEKRTLGTPVLEAPDVPLRTWAFVAGGVGGAGIGAFAILGSMASSKFDDLESTCEARRCPPGKQEDIDSGKSLQTLANVALGLGVIGLGTGVVLYVIDAKRDSALTDTRLRVAVGPGSVSVGGTLW